MKVKAIGEGMHVRIGWNGSRAPKGEDEALVGRTGIVWAKSALRPGDWWVNLDPSGGGSRGETVSVRSRDLAPAGG